MAKCKLTDKLCIDICNEIKIGTPMRHAAISHGISHDTFYRWYNKGKNAKSGKFKRFYDNVEEAKSVAIALRARRIHKAGESNWQADAWWLERTAPAEFGKHEVKVKMQSEVKNNIKGTIKHENKTLEDILKLMCEEMEE